MWTQERGGKYAVKVDLSRRELHLLKLWWLSCEDMMITEGTCQACEFKDECLIIRTKLYGKKSSPKSKQQFVNAYERKAEENVLLQPA